MNKARITGLVILVIGILIQIMIENDVADFISALFLGLGIGFLVIGKFRKQIN
ncbi:hypothetical protein [Yeosuana sp. AK3]